MVDFDRLPEQEQTTDFDTVPNRSSLMLDTVLLGEPTETDKTRRKNNLEAEVLSTGVNYRGPSVKKHRAYLSDENLAEQLQGVLDKEDAGKTLVRITVEYESNFADVKEIFNQMERIFNVDGHQLATQKIIAASL